MKSVLVTGGAGYIGSHTVEELSRCGYQVVVLDNMSTGHREAVRSGIIYQGDIADTPLIEHIIGKHDIHSVVHFAAKSLVGESFVHPEMYFYENTVKSFVFLDTVRKAGVKRLVFSSTAAVYGTPDTMPISENAAINPVNPYGASKRMIEEYLGWIGRAGDISWVALRYFNAAGAALDGSMGEDHRPETHLIPLVIHTLMGIRKGLSVFGTDYATPDGTCIRDYVHVVDLARAHVQALQGLEGGCPSQVFNLGTGQGYSVKEVINQAQRIVGRSLPVSWEARRPGDPAVLVADCSKIKSALNWNPQFSDLETILSSAWRWHSQNPDGYGSKQ